MPFVKFLKNPLENGGKAINQLLQGLNLEDVNKQPIDLFWKNGNSFNNIVGPLEQFLNEKIILKSQ